MHYVNMHTRIARRALAPLSERRNFFKFGTHVNTRNRHQTHLIVRFSRDWISGLLCPSHFSLTLFSCTLISDVAPALAQNVAISTVDSGKYVPSPMEVPSWEIWVGFIAGVIPFAIASVEFAKRILIQRRCEACGGRGLVKASNGRFRKCTQCGGLLPWLGWRAFWLSNLSPGNGGFLLQPKGQKTIFYQIPETRKEKTSLNDENQQN
jgi:hypothetical protein